jgi:hypothetical protein
MLYVGSQPGSHGAGQSDSAGRGASNGGTHKPIADCGMAPARPSLPKMPPA